MVAGRWSFASGCDNAQWLLLGGKVESAEGPPTSVFFLVEAAGQTIEDDWYSMGLEGTGSKTVAVDNVFVPDHRTVKVAELVSGTAPGTKIHENPLYRIPMLAVLPLCLAAPALGMAEGAYATFMDTTRTRVTRGAVAGGNLRVADFPTVSSSHRRSRRLHRRGSPRAHARYRRNPRLGHGGRTDYGRYAYPQSPRSRLRNETFRASNRRALRCIRRKRGLLIRIAPAILARHPCSRRSRQSELGFGRHYVRPACTWTRTYRTILANFRGTPT